MSNAQGKTPTGPHLAVAKQPSTDDLALLVGEVLKAQGAASGASAVSPEHIKLIEAAAKTVPKWVLYAAVTFIGPALTAFYGTYQAISALPPRVDAIEAKITEQGKQLDRLEALLLGASSRPAKVTP